MPFFRHAITRRQALKGAAAAGLATAAVSVLSSCKSGDDGTAPAPTVVDSTSATYITGSGSIQGTFEESGAAELNLLATWTTPLGTTLRPAEGSWKPFVTPAATGAGMTQAGVVSIDSGTLLTLVDKSVAGGTYVVYDARCSDEVFAWVELDIVSRAWKLYGATLDAGELGAKTVLWEATSDFDPPSLCCSGKRVLWLVMPSASGPRVTEASSCYLWKAGESSADEVVRSQGHFGCEPSISDGVVTLAPRVRTSEGRYYGITAYSLNDDLSTVLGQLVLPQSVAPFKATRIDDKFAFSIEANYSSGGLLGQMGTYIGNGDDPFLVLPIEPAADVSGKDGVYVIKARSSHLVIDSNEKKYWTLVAPNRSVDYGDYPATLGTTSTFVSFATVKDQETGYPSAVTIRAFAL